MSVMETKKPWLSKTVLLNVLIALAGVAGMLGVTSVSDFVTAHQDWLLLGLGGVGVVLRMITKGAVSLS